MKLFDLKLRFIERGFTHSEQTKARIFMRLWSRNLEESIAARKKEIAEGLPPGSLVGKVDNTKELARLMESLNATENGKKWIQVFCEALPK
jgi:hypothetical protein